MRCGPLRHRVTLQQKGTITKSATGEEVFAWQTIATVWGNVTDVSGREFLRGTAEHADLTTAVTIRYRDDLTPAKRVVWGDRVLDIDQVLNPDGRKREMQLLCREVVQ